MAGAVVLLGACSGELSALDPAGPAAERVATLWWVMLAGAVIILVGVVGAALYALRSAPGPREFSNRKVLIGWGLVFPVITLLALMAFAFLRGEQLLARSGSGDEEIRVHAERWMWSFEYPGGERTTNVLHVPAGEYFTAVITSEDVIHSFWVPRLGGKMDAIPGHVNRIRLQAGEPGVYRGTCAEFCGIGHAHMQFEVHAHDAQEYGEALAAAVDTAADPLPVLEQRPAPRGTVIEDWADYLLDWLGVT